MTPQEGVHSLEHGLLGTRGHQEDAKVAGRASGQVLPQAEERCDTRRIVVGARDRLAPRDVGKQSDDKGAKCHARQSQAPATGPCAEQHAERGVDQGRDHR